MIKYINNTETALFLFSVRKLFCQ